MIRLCMLAALLLLSGCSLFASGQDVRNATEAVTSADWDAEGNLSIAENTTHNRRVVMIEGEAVEVEYYADGTPKLIKGATQVLSQSSEPRDAAAVLNSLYEKNLQFGMGVLGLLGQSLPLFGRQPTAPAQPSSDPLSSVLDLWRSLTPEEQAQLKSRLGLGTQ